MISRCGIEDTEFVDKVLNHPLIRKFVSDDLITGPVDVDAILPINNLYVLKYGEYGLIIFTHFNSVTTNIHFFLLPEYHRNFPYHYKWVNDAIQWMFDNTGYDKIIGMTIHDFEHPAKAGFVREGKFTKSFYKDGILHDLHLYGACRDEWVYPTT